MTWVRVDDGMPRHPKFIELDDDAALALWVRALCYCNSERTDGFVSTKALRGLSLASDPVALADKLVAARRPDAGPDGVGLWIVVPGGYRFHNYEKYQPTKAQIEERSATKAKAGKAGGHASGEARRKQGRSEAEAGAKQSASENRSIGEAKSKPTPTPTPTPTDLPSPSQSKSGIAREKQGECQNEHRDWNGYYNSREGTSTPQRRRGREGEQNLPDGNDSFGESGRSHEGDASYAGAGSARVPRTEPHIGHVAGEGSGQQPVSLTPGRASGPPDDHGDLLGVLARLVADGNDWAAGVERWRQDNPGRALTEPQRKRLREIRDKAPAPRRVTAADEADAQAIVAAYVEAYRRIIADPAFVALTGHHADADAILPDARALAERAKRGDWRPTPAEVVAHRLDSYLRDRKNGPAFRLRWIFDRTEQDDLPKPHARVAPKEAIPDGPIGARRGPVLKPTPPPPDVAGALAKLSGK